MRHRKIIIETVPHSEQRYDTLGDWFFNEDGDLIIKVSLDESTPNIPGDVLSDTGFLIALHELIEVKLCMHAAITQAEVDAFDFAFTGRGEPGDHPKAPYRQQHRRAMLAELLMADWLDMRGYGVAK